VYAENFILTSTFYYPKKEWTESANSLSRNHCRITLEVIPNECRNVDFGWCIGPFRARDKELQPPNCDDRFYMSPRPDFYNAIGSKMTNESSRAGKNRWRWSFKTIFMQISVTTH